MAKQCPNCKSYQTILIGRITKNTKQNDVYVCKKCFNIFYDKDPAIEDKSPVYNPKFKQLYFEKKIPEIAEHKNFIGQEKISENDKADLKIDFWLMEHRKENENTRTDNK